ncbi:DNA polymerase [Nitrincola sp. A-D6]|uniref:DNA polymerase n=1 Tax=Nitrincola sp. A-D6 TaxID=1545442 RepID=UPI00190F2A09|nr:DNA polymerase [Nitrincola sp. A-D6]
MWVTYSLWKRIEAKQYPDTALRLETRAAWLLAKMERNGFVFDEKKAVTLYSKLAARRNSIKTQLIDTFGSWAVSSDVVRPKRSVCYKDPLRADRTIDAPFTPVTFVEFNPASRQHVAKVLLERGWKPTEFTDNGQPKVDETTLSTITAIPEAEILKEYFMLQKRIGQLAEGDQGWLRQVKRDGRIHGSINPNGAVTGRATHSFPNIGQVPSCGAPFGRECRELFTVPRGWLLMGTDMSGLELRCLGHFMAKWDGGAYIQEILNGDIHTANQMAAGLLERSQAKTFIYAFLYGAGDEKIGDIVDALLEPDEKAKVGKSLKNKFLKNTPALKKLRDAVQLAAKRGWLRGLDGRQVFVRSAHAALNTLLQSAGAIICKLWIVEFERLAQEAGFKHGWDGDYALCAWVHDEMQVACRNQEIADQLGAIAKQAAALVGDTFCFKCPLDSEHGVGASWADTH